MHPKGQGECKHRLMGMSEVLKCCAASRGGCAALRTWGFKACTGSRDAAAPCICQSPPGLTRTVTKRSPALPEAKVLPLCMEQWGGDRLREVQLHCQPTLTVCWERFPTLSLPGAIHQQLWDKREDLSKLCLPSSLDFPPATSIFSLGEHKIKSAFGLWTHVSSSRISCSTRLQLSAPSTGHHQHLPPPPLTQQRDNTEPRLEWLKLYFN